MYQLSIKICANTYPSLKKYFQVTLPINDIYIFLCTNSFVSLYNPSPAPRQYKKNSKKITVRSSGIYQHVSHEYDAIVVPGTDFVKETCGGYEPNREIGPTSSLYSENFLFKFWYIRLFPWLQWMNDVSSL
jgi:hypothetical protein